MKKILITGGLGYIGSHTVAVLEKSGFETVIVDNLSNASIQVLDRIETVIGRRPAFYKIDLLTEKEKLNAVFEENVFEGVIHFAAKKYVAESIEKPFFYYENNVLGSLHLLECMTANSVKTIIFSSTAGVYDSENLSPPFSEDNNKKTIHPYAGSKLIVENILEQLSRQKLLKSISLRYFNVIGAHPSSALGDNIYNETNLLGYIMRTLLGKQEKLNIYGNTFNTHDGTAIRDYIDVVDLAEGHLKALEYLLKPESESNVFNLGNGRGATIMELIKETEAVTGKKISYTLEQKREGDVGVSIADVKKTHEIMGWEAKIPLSESIKNAWNYSLRL